MNRIALVHDWFDCVAGSEKVVREMLKCFPHCTVYALIDHLDGQQKQYLGVDAIETSLIQRLPFHKKRFRNYLPLMPFAVEQFDVGDADVVLSSSHAFAKGVLTSSEQLHVSYVHTPIRYAWDLQHEYLRQQGLNWGPKAWLVRAALHYIRNWDRGTADRPDVYVANSHFVAQRIWKTYHRKAHVIYPPVDVQRFTPEHRKENFYLAAGRLVPYKRFDLVVEAFSQVKDAQLFVIGDGSEMAKLKSLAGPNVTLLGYQSDEVLVDYMRRAKGFVFGALEDFGIMPVEAMACGTPVIGLGRGGTRETIVHGKTGLHFESQTPDSLADAIATFQELPEDYFNTDEIRKHAEYFSEERFGAEFQSLVEESWQQHQLRLRRSVGEGVSASAVAERSSATRAGQETSKKETNKKETNRTCAEVIEGGVA